MNNSVSIQSEKIATVKGELQTIVSSLNDRAQKSIIAQLLLPSSPTQFADYLEAKIKGESNQVAVTYV